MIYVQCPDDSLNKLWREFSSLGITDDLTIIEHAAFLLLVRHGGLQRKLRAQAKQDPTGARKFGELTRLLQQRFGGVSQRLLPAAPSTISGDRLDRIMDHLEEALQERTPAELFDRCVMFRLPDRLAGGRYPTPRHIAQTMTRLVDVQAGETLADLACGSGGLLVAAADKKPRITGVEISPNWARLAWTNAGLHDLPKPRIEIADAISLFADRASESRFDCVLMNPSFGVPVDRSAVRVKELQEYGTRSETLLTAQALRTLKTGGRMAVLLPAGSLFGGGGERKLRQSLLDAHRLDAIIALNEDAFQPYSSIQTFLLVVHKPVRESEQATTAVWFYRVNHDGFTAGRNRQPDPQNNDLPLIEAALPTQGDRPAFRLEDDYGALILAANMLREGDNHLGYRFTRHADGILTLKRLGGSGTLSAVLLASVQNPDPVGHLLLRDGQSYAGLSKAEPTALRLPQESRTTGQYTLLTEDDTTLIFTLAGESTELRKGNRTHVLQQYPDDIDQQPLWFVVDAEGVPLSPPLTADTTILPSQLRPNPIIAIPLERADGESAGHLVVSATREIRAMPLTDANGRLIYLAEMPPEGMLMWSYKEDVVGRLEVFTSETVFTGNPHHQGVVVDRNGTWFGIQVPIDEIRQRDLDLQPSIYFPIEVEPRELRSPARLMADIKTKQRELDQHIDYLLGIIEMRPLAGVQLPPALEEIQPVGTLSGVQQRVWERIQSRTRTAAGPNGEPYPTPQPFQIDEISDELTVADVERALDLFERMGLIVRVNIEGAPYFRLVADRDLVEEEVHPE